MRRLYYIPINTYCSESCSYCPSLGSTSESKNIAAFEESLAKAKFGQYEGILLPCNALFVKGLNAYIESARRFGLSIYCQVNSRYLHDGWLEEVQKLSDLGVNWVCLLDGQRQDQEQSLEWIRKHKVFCDFLLVVNKGHDLRKSFAMLESYERERCFFVAPYFNKEAGIGLYTDQIYKYLAQLQKYDDSVKIKTYPGVDSFDYRINPKMELEPLIEPSWSTQYGNSEELDVSVVIPAYNNKNYLINTVRHLMRQEGLQKGFEVLVVDDGSDDGSMEAVKEFVESQTLKANISYVYFPRPQKRKMGDGQFRAGVARNLGVKLAKGKLLVFLDSDILTPRDYLKNLVEEHKEYDVVMTERLFLKEQVSHIGTEIESEEWKGETYIPEGGYWENFYRDTTPWSEMENGWKYACTYGFSLPKELFTQCGWFRKNYVYYGFEDTDLGYRLWNLGAKFKKSEQKVLHLFHETKRSEFKNSDYLRHELLKKTAKVFFYNQLDPFIYDHFRSLVAESPPLWQRVQGLFRGN